MIHIRSNMYYHYPYIGESAYVLWQRLLNKRKTGITRIRSWCKYGNIEKNGVFQICCHIGNLSLAKLLVQKGWPVSYFAIRIASIIYGHLNMIKWLYTIMDYDPMADNNLAIQLASKHGHLRVVKWLYHVGCDPTADKDYAIRQACNNGHLHVVKWLYSVGCLPYWGISNAPQNVIDFLQSIGCPVLRK